MKIRDPLLHMMASIITPFLAYLPCVALGGSGVIATVITGLIIGNVFSVSYAPEFRLLSRGVWPTISFCIESFLFILVGLNFKTILKGISSIPLNDILLYCGIIILIVVIGRFCWVYFEVYVRQFRFLSLRPKDPYPPWQFPIVVSWAGVRGSISLAAAYAVPILPATISGSNVRDLIIFLAFSVIMVTLVVQGLTLPWLLKVLRLHTYSQAEKLNEDLSEYSAKLRMINAALKWLERYKKSVSNDVKLLKIIDFNINNYETHKTMLNSKIKRHYKKAKINKKLGLSGNTILSYQLIEVEKEELLNLWKMERISLVVKNRLLDRLDYLSKYISE